MTRQYRTQYDEAADAEARAATDCANYEPSMTQQSFTADADINVVLHRFGITDGAIDAVNIEWSDVLDLSEAGDYSTIQQKMADARGRFMLLPANVREEFNNDPAQLLDWVSDPRNETMAIAMGFLKREDAPAPATTQEAPVSPST